MPLLGSIWGLFGVFWGVRELLPTALGGYPKWIYPKGVYNLDHRSIRVQNRGFYIIPYYTILYHTIRWIPSLGSSKGFLGLEGAQLLNLCGHQLLQP